MGNKNNPMKFGQLVLTDRVAIEIGIAKKQTFEKIGVVIQRHPVTVSREIKENRTYIPPDYPYGNDCKYARNCEIRHICGADPDACNERCKKCKGFSCHNYCKSYESVECHKTDKPPYEKVLVHAVLNSDGNANLIPDGDVANPMDITIAKSDITGDIIDEDYQREMLITLDETTLTGKIDWKNVDDWNAVWGVDGTIGTGDYAYDETYETVWGPVVTLTNGSTWVVTEPSYIKAYEVDETSQIIGTIEESGNGYIVMPAAE